MKTLAVIANSKCHMECLSNVLELYRHHKVDVWYREDWYGWLDYTKTLRPLQAIRYTNLCEQFNQPYDEVLLLTSHDFYRDVATQAHLSNYNVTSLLHLSNEAGKHDPWFKHIDLEPKFINRFITLSPWVKPKHRPYKYYLTGHSAVRKPKEDMITYVGTTMPNEIDDDFRCFCENLELPINLCLSNTVHDVPHDLSDNVRIFQGLHAFQLANILARSKYIMIRKHPYQQCDRFSGAIALALSFNCIPIMQTSMAKDYKIQQAMKFKHFYSELLNVDLIKHYDQNHWDYTKHIEGIRSLNLINNGSLRPKNIFQLYDDLDKVDPQVSEHIKELNPNYEYKLLDFEQALALIKPHFPPNRYDSIAKLLPTLKPSHASDVLRVCLLHAFGGVYIDVDLRPLVSFDDNRFPEKVSLITSFGQDTPLTQWTGDKAPSAEIMATGFMMSHANNPIFMDWLDMYLGFSPQAWSVHATPVRANFFWLKNKCTVPLLSHMRLPLDNGHKIYVIKEVARIRDCLYFDMVDKHGETLIQSNGYNYGNSRKVYDNYLNKALSYYYTDVQFISAYKRVPKMRDYTFNMCLKHLHKGAHVVELGTSRSYLDGRFPNWHSDDIKHWHPRNPKQWDWSAGMFTWYISKFANVKLDTVDIDPIAIEKSKVMTKEFDNINYHLSDSVDYILNLPPKSVDLMYLDTGNVSPVEPTATLHLNEAKAIIDSDCIKEGGWLLIDDCRNPVNHINNTNPHEYAKARYSIPYLLDQGYKMIADEYQIILERVPKVEWSESDHVSSR